MMIINQKQKEIKMKIITSIITVSLIAIGTTLFAQSSSRLLGNTYYHSNGSSSRLLGNTIYNSNNKSTPSYILKDNCYPCN